MSHDFEKIARQAQSVDKEEREDEDARGEAAGLGAAKSSEQRERAVTVYSTGVTCSKTSCTYHGR